MGPLLKSSTLALMILNHRPEVFDAGPDKRRCPQPDAAACTSNQDGPDPLSEYGENCLRPTSHPLVGPSTQHPAHLAFQQEKLRRRGGDIAGSEDDDIAAGVRMCHSHRQLAHMLLAPCLLSTP